MNTLKQNHSFTLVCLVLAVGAAVGIALMWARTASARPVEPAQVHYQYLPALRQNRQRLRVLENHTSYTPDWGGSLHLVGEVLNESNAVLREIVVQAKLYDRQEKLLQTIQSTTYLEQLPGGQKTCFEITVMPPPANWDSYLLEVASYRVDNSGPPALVVLNPELSFEDGGEVWIEGRVRNDAGRRVECVRAVGTVYDRAGDVLGCRDTYVDATHLNANQTSAFRLEFYGRDFDAVKEFQVQVHGDPR